jgi:hypothetical protein
MPAVKPTYATYCIPGVDARDVLREAPHHQQNCTNELNMCEDVSGKTLGNTSLVLKLALTLTEAGPAPFNESYA